MRVITLSAADALIKRVQPIMAELRANIVRRDSDFSVTPFKAKSFNAEREGKFPASSRRRLRLVLGGREPSAAGLAGASASVAPMI